MHNASRARLLLAFLLICQAALLVRPSQRFNGDEPYYVDKARFFFEHGRFEHVSAEAMAVERGERWGTSDWRPQGYPLFLATVSLGDFSHASLRPRVTAVQFALIAAAAWLLFEIMGPRLANTHPMAAATLLGAVPWPYDFAASLSPDSLTASVTLFSIVILWCSMKKENIPLMFVGAFLLSTTLLLRPEMLVLTPVSLAAVILLGRFDRNTLTKRATACAGAFVIVVAMQVAYRINVTGHPGLFGGLHIRDSGAFAWTNTWLGSENQAYNFVYGLSTGNVPELPARAFSDAEERRTVERVILLDRTRRFYGPDIDAVFQRLAEKRRREHPLLSIVATRIWHSVHLWLNLETSSQLLNAMANVPRSIRRPILGEFLLLKLALLAFFVVGAMRARESGAPALILLCTVIVVGRTLVLGTALNWTAHRYMLPAWLPLLACAIAGTQTWKSRLRASQPLSDGADRITDR